MERSKRNKSECFKTDPMDNDLVLQTIFKFCDVPSLKNCRLVSSKWRDLSFKAWRDSALIKLGPNSKLEFDEFLKMLNSEDGDNDDSLQFRKHPFKRYFIELEECVPGGEESLLHRRILVAISNARARYVKIYWDSNYFYDFNELLSILYTDSLQSLEVICRTFEDFDEEIIPISNVLKCSNLKRLRIYVRDLYYESPPERSMWPYLLRCFPKLEVLSIAYNSDPEQAPQYTPCLTDRLGIVTLLKNLRLSGGEENVLPLKELDMMDVVSKQKSEDYRISELEIIQALTSCKFPLERLTIHVGLYDEIMILPLLESCKDTLQYLKCSINFNDTFFNGKAYYADKSTGTLKWKSDLKPLKKYKSVLLEKLKEVRLVNGLEWGMFLLMHLDIPLLEKLIVDYEESRNHKECHDRYGLVSVEVPLETVYQRLETFELHDNLNIPQVKSIMEFVRMMPNLVHLAIPLDRITFPLICQHFRGLKTLNVLAGQGDYVELDDDGLTGLSRAEVKQSFLCRRPNITDLRLLTNLSISCRRQLRRDDVKFTEHSVMYGFLQLPRLYYLSVAIKELSEEMKEKLMSHVKGNVDFQKKQNPTPSSFVVEIVSDNQTDYGPSDTETEEVGQAVSDSQ